MGEAQSVACPSCGRSYRRRADLAGRQVRCGQCGATITMPPLSGAAEGPPESSIPPKTPPSSKPVVKHFEPVSGGFRLNLPGQPGTPHVPPKPPASPPSPPTPPREDDVPLPLEDGDLYALNADAASTPEPLPQLDEADLIEDVPEAQPVSDVESYELNVVKPARPGHIPAVPTKIIEHCPSCGSSVKPGAVICVNCGFDLVQEAQLQTIVAAGKGQPIDEATKHRLANIASNAVSRKAIAKEDEAYHTRQILIWDWYVPTGIVAGAIFLMLVNGLFLLDVSPKHWPVLTDFFAVKPTTTPPPAPTTPQSPGGLSQFGIAPGPVPGNNNITYPFMPAPRNTPAPGSGSPPGSTPGNPPATGLGAPPGATSAFPGLFGQPAPPPTVPVYFPWLARAAWILNFVLNVIISSPCLFVGMIIVGKLFGTTFGNLLTGMFKLLAICMMTLAVSALVSSILHLVTEGLPLLGMGIYIQLPFIVVTFFGLAMKLLDLDFLEAIILFVAMYLLPFALTLLFIMMVYAMIMT
ncbi:MAG: hypothetical protein IT440_13830 [Phycisphaeraceae bacterium]|nr:hypothetical protein [Phycisphaeraceae bacterium]